MIIDGKEYLTPQQFADAKGCSLKTVYNYMNAKEDSSGFRVDVEEIIGRKVINITEYKGKLNR